jgi:hypothetical protein
MPDERDDGRQFRYRKSVNPGRRFQLDAADLKVALKELVGLVAADGVQAVRSSHEQKSLQSNTPASV